MIFLRLLEYLPVPVSTMLSEARFPRRTLHLFIVEVWLESMGFQVDGYSAFTPD